MILYSVLLIAANEKNRIGREDCIRDILKEGSFGKFYSETLASVIWVLEFVEKPVPFLYLGITYANSGIMKSRSIGPRKSS